MVADLVAVILYSRLVPVLAARFQQKSAVNAALVGSVYLLFCAAVYLMRRLEGETAASAFPNIFLLAFTGVVFGLLINFMMADTAGIFDNLDLLDFDLNSAAASLGLFTGAIVWFLFTFLYTGVLIAKIRPTIFSTSWQHTLLQFLTLFAVNLMIIVATAHWEAYFAGTEPYDTIAPGGKILIFLLVYLFFLFFYAPPRLLFLMKSPRWTSIVTFLLQTSYYVWRGLSQTAW